MVPLYSSLGKRVKKKKKMLSPPAASAAHCSSKMAAATGMMAISGQVEGKKITDLAGRGGSSL